MIGHIEGGLIAPMVAANSHDIAFIVLMAACGVTGEEIMYGWGAAIERANGSLDVKLSVDPPPAPQNELKPRNLNLSDRAKAVWVEFHDSIDKELSSGGKLESIRRFGSKAAEHVLRLSGVLEMIDDPNVKLIEEKYIRMGISLVEYYLSEIARVQGYLSIPHNLVLAQKVLDWCWYKDKDQLNLRVYINMVQMSSEKLRKLEKSWQYLRNMDG